MKPAFQWINETLPGWGMILLSTVQTSDIVDFFTFPAVEWWRHQMETFSALLTLCAGNSPVTSEFPAQRPVTRSFGVFFHLHLKRLSKQSWGWWFETLSRPLWRHCNGLLQRTISIQGLIAYRTKQKVMSRADTVSYIINSVTTGQ